MPQCTRIATNEKQTLSLLFVWHSILRITLTASTQINVMAESNSKHMESNTKSKWFRILPQHTFSIFLNSIYCFKFLSVRCIRSAIPSKLFGAFWRNSPNSILVGCYLFCENKFSLSLARFAPLCVISLLFFSHFWTLREVEQVSFLFFYSTFHLFYRALTTPFHLFYVSFAFPSFFSLSLLSPNSLYLGPLPLLLLPPALLSKLEELHTK